MISKKTIKYDSDHITWKKDINVSKDLFNETKEALDTKIEDINTDNKNIHDVLIKIMELNAQNIKMFNNINETIMKNREDITFLKKYMSLPLYKKILFRLNLYHI